MTNEQPLTKALAQARRNVETLDALLADLNTYRDQAAAEIAQYLRVESGISLNPEAIKATLTRPYTLLPDGENEAWLIHWRGVEMPIFGWVVAAEPAFVKARITRSMDLLTPMPAWMKDELGWKPPAHQALVDGTRGRIDLTEGDEGSFKRRYGSFLGGKNPDGSYKIKGGDAWIKLVASLVRDGILPYAPTPVAPDHWTERADHPDLLASLITRQQERASMDYIQAAIDEFRSKGAVLINYPPGAGKTLIGCAILNHFRGRVLILGDSTTLIEQWQDRVAKLAPDSEAEITISTYQGAQKYLSEEWDLLIADEAQRLPAATFSRLAFVQTRYRLGLTATPWREDDRQHLVVALSGFPVAIRWANLINSGVLRRPRITVATVPNAEAKTGYVRTLLAGRKGRALIFCDYLEQGQALADALDVPFVHGSTPRKLQKIAESEVVVVSRVADRGVSLPDLRLVIEVAGAGGAREQFAQRVGRLLHGDFEGEFYTVFTPDELARYRGRIFGVEAETAGQVEINFITVGGAQLAERSSAPRAKRTVARSAPRAAAASSTPAREPKDEIERTLAIPAIAAKIDQASQRKAKDAPPLARVMRYCWDAALSPQDITEGLGMVGEKQVRRMRSSLDAAAWANLVVVDKQGRYKVNQEELNRLRALAQLRKR